jgi:hypothetical protein
MTVYRNKVMFGNEIKNGIQAWWCIMIEFFFCYCYTGGMMWYLQKFLQYIIVEFTPK